MVGLIIMSFWQKATSCVLFPEGRNILYRQEMINYKKIIFSLFIGLSPVWLLAQAGTVHTLWVDGICGMCKDRIEDAAYGVRGVAFAEWNVDTRILTIRQSPEPFSEVEAHSALAAVGHDTREVKASDEAYDALHACCKYRDSEVIAAHAPQEESAHSEGHGHLHGTVYEPGKRGRKAPLIGANVTWAGTSIGAVTDEKGFFELDYVESTRQLVVSYVGFPTDTVLISQDGEVEIVLSGGIDLEEVEVTHRRRSTEVSFIDPIKVQRIGEKELAKAACCNLSESFETTPSVDVGFTDAVTGTRQIQMLGLSSPYIQIARENMPDVRGLAVLHGMEYTPGPWISSIMLNMGAGSVVNGFEGIAGQINVELHKPEAGPRLFFNAYTNAMQRLEGNLSLRHSFNERWHTGLLVHAKQQQRRFDQNNDGFLDNPLSETLTAINRWKFIGENGLMGQFGVKATRTGSVSGQFGFDPDDADHNKLWGATHDAERLEGWFKMGKVFENRPYASIGLQVSATYHNQDSRFGLRNYSGDQRSAYVNLIYQTIITDTRHQIKTGLSYQWDEFDEQLDARVFARTESVPGVFGEYTWKGVEDFTVVAGLRADYHNLYGGFLTPRLHLKYNLSETAVLRGAAGRGQRTANVIMENIGGLASARQIQFIGQPDSDLPFGLEAEVAWNFGLNYAQEIQLGERPLLLSLDAYRTNFEQQVVADYETAGQLSFYNLTGASYSNSLQVQADYEVLPRWDLRMAYRFNDVRMTYEDALLYKPLVARQRAFFNTAYETRNGWAFDATLSWQGPKRIPNTTGNPPEYQLEAESPDFFLLNAQVTKSWKDGLFELYAGGENLLNFRQEDPILSSNEPFSPYFDASMVWGPIFGRNLYAGLRYRIE